MRAAREVQTKERLNNRIQKLRRLLIQSVIGRRSVLGLDRTANMRNDEFIEAGWKERQVYDVATLPSALEARYGFFNRRDVEIRRYASHAVAIAAGAAAAEDALDRTVHDGSGFRRSACLWWLRRRRQSGDDVRVFNR